MYKSDDFQSIMVQSILHLDHMSVADDYCWFEPYIYEYMNEQGRLTVNFGISLIRP